MPAVEAHRRPRGMPHGQRLVAAIWDRPGWWLAVVLAITVLAISQVRTLGVDNSVEIWFADGDPALTEYRNFQDLFGSDDSVAVFLHDPRGLTEAAGLARLRKVSNAVSAVDGVARADSLATLDAAVRDAIVRGAAVAGGNAAGRLISRDRTTVAIVASLAPDSDADRDRILADIRATLADMKVEYRMIGIGVIYAALNKLSAENTVVLFVASSLVTLVLLWLVFGRLAPACLCLVIVTLATVWTMGAFGPAGRSINMVTMVLPTLIMVIGVANCIHVLRHVAGVTGTGNRRESVLGGVGEMLRPCGFITLTTAAGFAALMFSPMPVLRDLGAFAALGMVAVLALTVVLCTLALRWWRLEANLASMHALGLRLVGLGRFCMQRRRSVVAGSIAVMILAASALPFLTVDTYSIGFLPFDHPVRQDYRFVEAKFGPYTPLEFVARAEPGIARETVLAAVADWQARARTETRVGWSYSLADWRRQAGQSAMAPPASLYSDGALRVTFAVPMGSARDIARDIDALSGAARMPAGVRISPSGYLPLYVRMMDRIVSSQIRGFALAFIAVIGAVLLLYRSVQLTVMAAVTNVLPVGVVLGTMSVAGIPLDVATVTIAAIVLGIAVDDTIFLLDAFRRARIRGLDETAAAIAAVREAGTSMVLTTLVLVGGFLVCALADVKSIVWFGILLALAMTAALVADLVLLPALLGVVRRLRKETGRGRMDRADPQAQAGRAVNRYDPAQDKAALMRKDPA